MDIDLTVVALKMSTKVRKFFRIPIIVDENFFSDFIQLRVAFRKMG